MSKNVSGLTIKDQEKVKRMQNKNLYKRNNC